MLRKGEGPAWDLKRLQISFGGGCTAGGAIVFGLTRLQKLPVGEQANPENKVS